VSSKKYEFGYAHRDALGILSGVPLSMTVWWFLFSWVCFPAVGTLVTVLGGMQDAVAHLCATPLCDRGVGGKRGQEPFFQGAIPFCTVAGAHRGILLLESL